LNSRDVEYLISTGSIEIIQITTPRYLMERWSLLVLYHGIT